MLKWFCFIALLVSCGAVDLPLDDEDEVQLSKRRQVVHILNFSLNGFEHNESRRVEGSIVTVTDVMDGFLVILDFQRDILMIKNLTTQTCFFSRLENAPIQKSDKTALMVKEVTTDADLEARQHDVDVVLFSPVGQIPSSYVHLTNDVTVAGACVSQPSYWLEMEVASRQRRDCDAYCGAGIVVFGILLGLAIG